MPIRERPLLVYHEVIMVTVTPPPDVMTLEQAAAYLQVSRRTLSRYIREGKVLASRIGREYRIPRRQIDLLLWASHTRPDIRTRDYSPEEIARFIEDDRLNDAQESIIRRFVTSVISPS
jgi:excisionase family DNA binding protein